MKEYTSVKAALIFPEGPSFPNVLCRKVESKLMVGREGLRRRPSFMLKGEQNKHKSIIIIEDPPFLFS